MRLHGKARSKLVYAYNMLQIPHSVNCNAEFDNFAVNEPNFESGSNCTKLHNVTFVWPVHGLDSAVGLRRAMGLEDFYFSILRSFAASRRNTGEQIRVALSLQDFKKAEHLSHSLLGISAQIGALHVPEDARALEDAISAGLSGEVVNGLVLRVEVSLAELIESIELALPPEIGEI